MGKLADLAARCLAVEDDWWEKQDINHQIFRAAANDSPNIPAYTTSIDCALTLIPNGWRWSLEYVDGYWASVNSGVSFPTLAIAGHLTSPALALCAAALRARDLVEGEGA